MSKWWIFDKWVIASILYVALVIGGFTVYEEATTDDSQTATVQAHQSEGNHEGVDTGNHGQPSHSMNEGHSEVTTFVQAGPDGLNIFLKDLAGNPVRDLEISHEKIFHLIIVDEQLQKYYHVHPEQTGLGEFLVDQSLPEGFYKAFVDIKPKNLEYHVKPIPFVVGHPGSSSRNQGLQPDKALVQHIDGETVTMNMSSFEVNTPVTLAFDLDRTHLTPYLGAMGHVVILDETAQKFLHVHPANHEEPIFETRFDQPGRYKIWAEFKQNGKVRVFPFVVEIKGAN